MTADESNLTIEDSIFIARPADDIWNFLYDINNDQLWGIGVVETRWTSDEPSKIGSTAVYVIEGFGEVHWKLTGWEEQRIMGWDTIDGRFDGGHGSYRMEPEAGGSRMTMRIEIRSGVLSGFFMKFYCETPDGRRPKEVESPHGSLNTRNSRGQRPTILGLTSCKQA
jgi:uncharacterized membrane protein